MSCDAFWIGQGLHDNWCQRNFPNLLLDCQMLISESRSKTANRRKRSSCSRSITATPSLVTRSNRFRWKALGSFCMTYSLTVGLSVRWRVSDLRLHCHRSVSLASTRTLLYTTLPAGRCTACRWQEQFQNPCDLSIVVSLSSTALKRKWRRNNPCRHLLFKRGTTGLLFVFS